MNTDKIFDDDGKGFTRVFYSDKVEKVNPIEYYKVAEIRNKALLLKDFLYAKDPFLASALDDDYFIRKAEELLGGFCKKCEEMEVHENFIQLLSTTRKKDQIRLLKGMSINPEELLSLIFKSYSQFGYLYSKYSFRNLPNGFEGRKLPRMFRLKEDGVVDKAGETEFSDGELKHIIEHRKVIVSHFFEKGETWHCFFLTYKSVGGRENWKEGQPHFHYISSSFGITKDDFVESMRNGKYRSTPIHIDLLDYGKQPKTD